MKRFSQFIFESPWETEQTVPVSVYLPQPVNETWAERIQQLLAALKDGRVTAGDMLVSIAQMVPTQAKVSQPKVMRYMQQDVSAERPPVVLQHPSEGCLIIDGHHRICGAACAGQQTLLCLSLCLDQVNSLFA